jgi:cytoskeletal protein RodZ
MRQVLVLAVFMLATLVWTMAQQPGASGGQATSPSSQTPSAGQSQPSQSQPSAPDSAGQGSTDQSPAQSSQTPNAGQSQPSPSQPSAPGNAGQGSTGQGSAQSGADQGTQSPAANAPITEGCLGGSNPNFTITDKAGTTYKLNIPQGADTSVLTPHVGESVQVMGQITNGGGAGKASSIDVSKIGRGQGGCPADKSKQPKQ